MESRNTQMATLGLMGVGCHETCRKIEPKLCEWRVISDREQSEVCRRDESRQYAG